MANNYTPYHIHSMLSNGITNIDSITDFHDYVNVAKDLGMKAFAFSEHGSMFAWLKKKEYIESCGMKYIHAVEAYLTEDNESKPHLYSALDVAATERSKKSKDTRVKFYHYQKNADGQCIADVVDEGRIGQQVLIDESTIKDEGYKKDRDNYHIVLIAKNYDGVKELNKLVSKSFCRDDFHFYYMPRISFDELFATSDNIIVTTACLGGALFSGTPSAKEKLLGFIQNNKHRCFLEIQHHNCKDQIEYNRLLYQIHLDTGVPLITGTDTHALNDTHMEGRAMLQKAKGVHFSNEDEWDLTFKSYEQLVEAYQKQNSLPMDVVYEAIENTNKMADMVEEFKIDYSAKYPKLYEDSEAVFKQKINEGVKKRGIMKYPNYQEYLDRIHYEYDTYKHNGAIDFMLLEENYKSEMRKKGIKYGYSRGSVSGSIIAYLLYITEIDSVKYNLNFSRFMNKERVSLADIDTDWFSADRDAVKQYLYHKKGLYCCDIATFNTIALKGAIRDICRALYKDTDFYSKLSPKWQKKYDEYEERCKYYNGQGQSWDIPEDLQKEIDRVNGNYLKLSEEIIVLCEDSEAEARNQYPEVFKYVDMVNGVVVSVGNHPAACVVSPFPVDEWFGTFTTSSDAYPISLLNMKEIDALNFVKLDILGLDNVGLIYKTCELAGIPYATPDNIPADDMNVWNSIRNDTTMIFQWESPSATQYLKQLMSDETIAKIKQGNKDLSYMDLLSIGNGAIRPAGESYRDKLAQGIYQDNGHSALNEFMKSTLGYCIEENQLVNTIRGKIPIKDIQIGDTIYTKDGTSTVINKVNTGIKQTIKIKTKSDEIICTNDHRIFTALGWKKAEDISVGDCIALRVGNANTKSYDIDRLMLIGYLLGDGILNGHNNVIFVNRDINVINNFSRIVNKFENCCTSVCNRGSRVNKLDLYYANVKHLILKKCKTSVAKYLCEVGLKYEGGGGKLAREKNIPNFVFELNTECMTALLGAYTDTDCSIKKDTKKSVIYKTASKQLKNDLVELLRLIGYASTVYYDSKTDSYAVVVMDAAKYLKQIYNYSYKVRKTYSLQELNGCKSRDSYMPMGYAIELARQYGLTKKQVGVTTGVNLYANYLSIYGAKKIEAVYPSMFPRYLFNENLKFVPVTSIESYGESNVYDLTIQDEHNFVCQNIVVHNCIYQEEIIEFLHSFCGYTMGEADIVRRGFAKKTGTEQFIPKIKEGFIKTMKEKYDVDSEEAEKLIVNFIQVIEDASSYLFSKNHADPYSWIGYICGYLRYYYPLEFITSALNIFTDEDKSLAIINYAKKQGIRISSIKFRHSIAQYSFDKESNQIFKGLSSIKYLNEAVANEIYALRDNNYDSFIDLLKDLDAKTSINSRQLDILINLDFFSEFGDTNYLLKVLEIYNAIGTVRQYKKDKLATLGIDCEVVRLYAKKETDKTFSEVDSYGLMKEICSNIKYTPRTLKEKAEAQIEHLGYIDIADKRYSRMLVVMSVDTKYAPKLKVYSLKNGTNLDVKIDKKTFNKLKLEKKDIIHVTSQVKKPKLKRLDDGTYEPIVGTSEIWLTKYEKINNI